MNYLVMDSSIKNPKKTTSAPEAPLIAGYEAAIVAHATKPVFMPTGTAPALWGPGDLYSLLATGKETNNASFQFEAIVPEGGGPPPHIHSREDESFYIVSGSLQILLGDKTYQAKRGDFVYIPRGTIHQFKNVGRGLAVQLVTFVPAGMERFFQEVFPEVKDRNAATPPVTEELIKRMNEAAPKYGLEFVAPPDALLGGSPASTLLRAEVKAGPSLPPEPVVNHSPSDAQPGQRIEHGERLETVFNDLVEDLKAFIRRHGLSYEEYHRAVEFVAQAGTAGEVPLLMDVFLEGVVDDVNYGGRPGTESNVEGPYYVPGTPLLEPPGVLPQRENEEGEILFFSGTVRSSQGVPLVGALLDLWQADASGLYSHFNYQEPRYNLRGRLYTDDKARFEVRTVVPASYPIPTAGPTGSLLRALGRQPFRPAHLHVKLSHEGFEPLTTQLYFKGDPLLDSDVASAVKASLIATLIKHDSPADLEERGLNRPYFTLVYDFTLRPRIG